jgi:hypothetical protein
MMVTSNRRGRPPPIILTSATNLIQLQKKLKGMVKGNFEFRNTRTGTRVVTKEMADFSAIQQYLTSQNLHYFTFFPKSLKPIKAVIRHLPGNTPAAEIYEGLVELGFDIVSVKQMSTTRRSQDLTSRNLPLFLITLPRSDKSLKIFKLTSLSYIKIKVETYKSQATLKQCHNCQQFGHVWANCMQPPHCLWCRGGHLHRECPEKGKEDSTPACCNCKLADGEKPHPSNYRGCSHAKEMRRRRGPRASEQNTGRAFSSKYIEPGMSFAAALKSKADEAQQCHPSQPAAEASATFDQPRVHAPRRRQETGQSVQAPNESSDSQEEMFRAYCSTSDYGRAQGYCI